MIIDQEKVNFSFGLKTIWKCGRLSAFLIFFGIVLYIFPPILAVYISGWWWGLSAIVQSIAVTLIVSSVFLFLYRLVNSISLSLMGVAKQGSKRIWILILPLIRSATKFLLVLVFLKTGLMLIDIQNSYVVFSEKLLNMLLVGALGGILIQGINRTEQYFAEQYTLFRVEDLRARILYTKVHVLKKIAITIVVILTIAAVLMVFDSVRKLGISILASAGFLSVLIGFAAQKTLGSMFSGLQIALTQPIKIDDAVIFENEFGSIEEITLTTVIIRLWDGRKLVVPINYFIEKPFQNWSRKVSSLIGAVFIYTDYSLPMSAVRKEFQDILQTSSFWDGKVATLQVTDAKEHDMELRFLVSAANPGKIWDLRCEVREKIIAFINKHYPQCLPKLRIASNDSSSNQKTLL